MNRFPNHQRMAMLNPTVTRAAGLQDAGPKARVPSRLLAFPLDLLLALDGGLRLRCP